MKPKKVAVFEFSVEGLTDEQAGKLLDIIVSFVEAVGGELGGGMHYEDDNEEVQAAE